VKERERVDNKHFMKIDLLSFFLRISKQWLRIQQCRHPMLWRILRVRLFTVLRCYSLLLLSLIVERSFIYCALSF
jgi:hypothetical protein